MDIRINIDEKLLQKYNPAVEKKIDTATLFTEGLASMKEVNDIQIDVEGSIYKVTLGASLWSRLKIPTMATEVEEILKDYVSKDSSVKVKMKSWSII